MALELTNLAKQASNQQQITPQLVLEIDGVDTLYGVVPIKKIVKIGDFNIGDPGIFIGGQVAIVDQESVISFSSGTSSEIGQTLNQDKGTNESISTMRIAMIDQGQKITKLITPGEVVTDILGRKCRVWLGFADTNWKDDYQIIFRAIITGVEAKAGVILFDLSSPDKKKKATILPKVQTKLTQVMNPTQVHAHVASVSDFLFPYTGPNGSIDQSLKFYLRIDDEVMRYETSITGQFQTLTRGQLGTTAVSHAIDATVDSFYVLEGNAIDLALKILLSGKNGPYIEARPITNFVRISPTETVANSIYFEGVNLPLEYNPSIGDFISTSGASNPANNVTNKEIIGITQTSLGWYIVIDGVSFVEENATLGVIDFRSQYDVFGLNAGLGLGADEVDVKEHLSIKAKYLSSTQYKMYIKDTIDNGQEFLSEQIYNPVSAYSLPRKAQASVGIHTGPVPGTDIKEISSDNVINSSGLSLKRSVSKDFYNSIIYKFDEDVLEEKFLGGSINIDGTSVTQIPVGNTPLILEAKGLRQNLDGDNIALVAGNRRLNKYKFGAESIPNVQVNFKTGFSVEIGDKVIVDMSSLKIADKATASREGKSRLFEVVNKKLAIGTGKISLDLVDTNYSLTSRYALIGPASFVKVGNSQTEFIIDPSFNTSAYGVNEYKKWIKYVGGFVKIHNSDFTVSGTAFISNINGNTITVSSPLGFVPLAGYIMELGDYDSQPDNVKLVYGFMSNGGSNFGDGGIPYKMS